MRFAPMKLNAVNQFGFERSTWLSPAQENFCFARTGQRFARPGASPHVTTRGRELEGEGRTLPKAALGKKKKKTKTHSFAKKGFCIAKEESAKEICFKWERLCQLVWGILLQVWMV